MKENSMSNEQQPATLQERIKLAAEEACQAIKPALPGAEGALARPYAVAALVQQKPGESGTQSVALETVLSAYYAQVLSPLIPSYLSLHTLLAERGYTSSSDSFCINMSDRLWAVPVREVAGLPDDEEEVATTLALVLETASQNFILVFNYDCGWSMHIRQVWRDVRDVPGSALHRMKKRSLSAAELVVMASDAVDFSDDLPGATYVRRPALSTYLNGTLLAKRDDSTRGLQYGDCRDPGYIVSIQEANVVGLPTVEDGEQVPYRLLAYVVNFISHAASLHKETVNLA
jgi:hypothetical protein